MGGVVLFGGSARGMVVALAVVAVVGSLAPFRIDPPRRVVNQAVRGDGELVLAARGVATVPSVSGQTILDGLAGGPVVVVVEVASSGFQRGPARILAMSDGSQDQDLVIGQEGRRLIVRVRRAGSSAQGMPSMVVRGVFVDRRTHVVEVWFAPDGVTLILDGDPAGEVTGDVDVAGAWDPGHRLLLGNERGGTRPWLGTIERATLTTSAGSIDLVEDSILPTRFWVVPDRWAGATPWYAPWNPTASQLAQAVVFAALGFLAVQVVGDRRRRVAMARCVAFSIALLALKFLVGGRHPSLADTVVEVASAGVGVLVAGRWTPPWPRADSAG